MLRNFTRFFASFRIAMPVCAFWAFIAPACASTSPEQRARHIADHAFRNAARSVATATGMLQMRCNPCACDDALRFEAHIYGRWQYVYVNAKRDRIEALFGDAESCPKTPFEIPVIFDSALYEAASGQAYYSVQIPDGAVIRF